MKHCIKLCTKIQIYYSYCIPFSTDFLGLFFQFSWQQHSQAGKTRARWVPVDLVLGGSCQRDVGTAGLMAGRGHWQECWHPLHPGWLWLPDGVLAQLHPPPPPRRASGQHLPAPGAALGPAEPSTAPSSLHAPWPHPRTVVPLCSLLPLALLPGLAQCLGPALPGPPQSPWGPCPGSCKEPHLLALRHGQC